VGCKHRVIPLKYVNEYRQKIEKLEPDIDEIKEQEKQERLLRLSEMETTKMENMIKNMMKKYQIAQLEFGLCLKKIKNY